jgi:hypothetical protein
VRLPADRLRERDPVARTTHLAVGTDEPRRRWLELADVVIAHRDVEEQAHWVRETLAAIPGCLLACARGSDGRWVVGTAERAVAFDAPHWAGPLCASAVHGWLTAGGTLADLPAGFTVVAGSRRARIGRAR